MLDFLFPHLHRRLCNMNAAIERMTNEVRETRTAVASVLTLVAGLAEQMRQNAGDAAAIEALADELDAAQIEIADAVAANTPEAAPLEPAQTDTVGNTTEQTPTPVEPAQPEPAPNDENE